MGFEEQILFKDKYPSIVSSQNGDCRVYYPSNLLRNMHSFENWGTLDRISPSIRSCDLFRPIVYKHLI